MKVYVAILCLILVLGYYSANALVCMKCEGPTNAACYKGYDSQTEVCPVDKPVCFLETIRKPGKRIGSHTRGCATADWCEKEIEKYKNDLKFCDVCEEDKCNKV
ncbi:hypothetical protein HHI36_003030 [Cryptolaemus montrouzieri]|uniref:UPAR/Ly6 domain-containing protein n=1 Tax=Cryptolaemus montrouzieri TaxID=559131 RepID=A0ABD2PD75_9CUCU